MKKFFSTNKPIKITMIILAVFLLITISYALSRHNKNKENENNTIKVTQKESNKETEKETKKEVETKKENKAKKNISKKETEKETKKEKETKLEKDKKDNKKIANKDNKNSNNNKNQKLKKDDKFTSKVSSSTTSSNKPQQKTPKKEVNRTTNTESIPFDTIDNYAYTGGKSRVYQEGRTGERTIVRENGEVVSNTVTRQPQDKIIERYVKIKSAEYETREIEDKSRPIYSGKTIPRWFVKNDTTGETVYVYSAGEAEDLYLANLAKGQLSSWGTAENEFDPNDGEILGYETTTETVKVSDEIWEWKH